MRWGSEAPGALYAEGGTLARYMPRMPPEAFALPKGFVPVAVPHMTLLDIADSKVIRSATGLSSRKYEAWLEELVHDTNAHPWGEPIYYNVGYAEQGVNAAYFEIWEWPELQEWRQALNFTGLLHKDLHVTIGVCGADIHGVRKDRTTKIPL